MKHSAIIKQTMTSFLIINKNKESRSEYISNLCKQNAIRTFDITIIEKDETKQSLGIDDVKQMQKKLFLKPLHSKTKAVILEDAQSLTTEAQNAMLKVLEEPPEHTLLILSADSEEGLLPTIQSRCQIVKLKEEGKAFSEKEEQEVRNFIDTLNHLSNPQALKIAETMAKDKQKALDWIERVILIIRENLLQSPNISSHLTGEGEVFDDELSRIGEKLGGQQIAYYFLLIKSFQSLHTLLKTTNVNPRLAIEHTLLSLL